MWSTYGRRKFAELGRCRACGGLHRKRSVRTATEHVGRINRLAGVYGEILGEILRELQARRVARLTPEQLSGRRDADVRPGTDGCASFSKLLGWPRLVQWHDLDAMALPGPAARNCFFRSTNIATARSIFLGDPEGRSTFSRRSARCAAGILRTQRSRFSSRHGAAFWCRRVKRSYPRRPSLACSSSHSASLAED